jgi:NADH-ubiquinone oxidoreductase chain 5
MHLLIFFLPLIGSIGAGFLGYFVGSVGVIWITLCGIFVCWFSSVYAICMAIMYNQVSVYYFFSWFESSFIELKWGLLFDSLTSVMCFVVSSISFLVHIFSISYMRQDPHFNRFMSYLSLFTFFMLVLITSNNFVQLFLGWEGVGLCSYLLINFWYTRVQANKAAIKAIVVNRFGDFGLCIALILIVYFYKSLEFGTVFSMVSMESFSINVFGLSCNVISLIGFFLFLGAIGKSAQLGLHTWLPDAMEGPTPVSALIHAATMVTAGVFVLIRCSSILEESEVILFFITFMGAITAFFAATVGLFQNDIKKVIAYSTCSQLGYMVFICGLSAYELSFFHLVNHAFFKALLFLSAGVIIHAVMDEQDMRKMGGLKNFLPITYVFVFFGSLSLMGFPFLTGFYSKDVILEIAVSTYTIVGFFSYFLGVLSAFFTAFYSLRLLFLTFLAVPAGYKSYYLNVHETDTFMFFSLISLFCGALFFGFFGKDLFIGLGTDFWSNAIFVQPLHIKLIEAEFLPVMIKFLPVCLSVFGGVVAFGLYKFFYRTLIQIKLDTVLGRELYFFLIKKWYFDGLQTYFIVKPILFFGYFISFKFIDRGLIEILGPRGIVLNFNSVANNLASISVKSVYNYIFLFFVSISVYVYFIDVSNNWGFMLITAKLCLVCIFLISVFDTFMIAPYLNLYRKQK